MNPPSQTIYFDFLQALLIETWPLIPLLVMSLGLFTLIRVWKR